jgi:hypothetical protein
VPRKSRAVHIEDPRDPGRTYTSIRRAAEYIQRGIAVYVPGMKEPTIRFTDDSDLRRRKQIELHEAISRLNTEGSILAARNGHIWWNGCDPLDPTQQYHREPGRAPQFSRPDQFGRFPKRRIILPTDTTRPK